MDVIASNHLIGWYEPMWDGKNQYAGQYHLLLWNPEELVQLGFYCYAHGAWLGLVFLPPSSSRSGRPACQWQICMLEFFVASRWVFEAQIPKSPYEKSAFSIFDEVGPYVLTCLGHGLLWFCLNLGNTWKYDSQGIGIGTRLLSLSHFVHVRTYLSRERTRTLCRYILTG